MNLGSSQKLGYERLHGSVSSMHSACGMLVGDGARQQDRSGNCSASAYPTMTSVHVGAQVQLKVASAENNARPQHALDSGM